MSGAPEIRITAATAGAVHGRSAEGRTAKEGEGRSSAFESVFSETRPASGTIEPKGRAAPMRRLSAEGGEPKLEARAEAKDDNVADPDDAARGATEVVNVTLDTARHGQSLAGPVAEHIVALLDAPGANAAHADAEPDVEPKGGRTRIGAIAAKLALAMSGARTAETAGKAGVAADVSVTRRETHFAPVSSPAGGRSSGGGAGAVSVPAEGGTAAMASKPIPAALRASPAVGPEVGPEAGSEPDAEPGRGPVADGRGRAAQIMMAGRAAQAKAVAPSAGAAMRAGASETAPGGPDGTGIDASDGAPPQGTAAPGGAGILRFGGPAPSAAAQVSQPSATSATNGAAGPVKVLHIQLQPVELGTLEVRMRLTDAGLHVHIESSRHETVALLKSDHETLAKVLRGAGHAVDAVTVSFSDKGSAQAQSSQDGGNPTASGARPDAQSGSPREQGGRPDDGSSSRPQTGLAIKQVHDDHDQTAVADRRHGDLYL